MFDREQYLDKRLSSLLHRRNELQSVLARSVGSLVVSFEDIDVSTESLSKEMKNQSDLIVEFSTVKINEVSKRIYNVFETNRIEDIDKLRLNVAKIAYVLKQNFDFNDSRGKWYIDDLTLVKLRAPVLLSYQNLFRETPNLQPEEADIDFDRAMDLMDISKLLIHSGAIQKLPLVFLKDKKLLSQLDRYLALYGGISESLKTQYDTILNILRGLLTKLTHRETIAKSEEIDLDKTQTVCLGNVLNPDVYTTVQKVWYRSNMSTALGTSGRNLRILLEEPEQLFNPSTTDISKEAIDNITVNFSTEDTISKLQQLRRIFIGLVDLICEMSKALDELTDSINEKPHQTNEGFYNYGLEDIAVYISEFSLTLTSIIGSIEHITTANQKANVSLEQFAKRLENHLVVINTYIQKRKSL